MTGPRRSMPAVMGLLALLFALVGAFGEATSTAQVTDGSRPAITAWAGDLQAVVARPVEARAEGARPLDPAIVVPLLGAALLLALWRPSRVGPVPAPAHRRHRSVGRRAPPRPS